jgi:hypothetical protein
MLVLTMSWSEGQCVCVLVILYKILLSCKFLLYSFPDAQLSKHHVRYSKAMSHCLWPHPHSIHSREICYNLLVGGTESTFDFTCEVEHLQYLNAKDTFLGNWI